MAKKIHEEDIKLNIIINGDKSQKELADLDKSTKALVSTNKDLKKAKAELVAQGKRDSQEFKNLTNQIKENNATIKANEDRMKALRNAIGINALSIQQLRKHANELKYSLNTMVPGTTEWKNLNTQLQETNARIRQLTATGQAQKLSFGAAADWLNRYQTMLVSVAATITGLTYSVQKWMDYMGELSDAESDVMKTASMTKTEIEDLSKSLGELDTRTSRINLLKIAEEGGRIGIAKEEMADFVKVMDQVYVALGDSFTGGVEEVASKLGKLKMLFEETKDMDVPNAYNAIGSAINDLGANGVATENNIAEFTTRIGALPQTLKPSIADTLALGAAFEESGIEAEVSARAYSIFLNRASTETASFAKVMGLPVEKVKEMINANPLEFFLKFAERLKGINPEAVEMAQLLDHLKINADGANKVIGAAANNSERFRETIELSNQSFISANSLLNEFAIKNSNLAAIMDKTKKTFAQIFSSETLTKVLGSSIEWFAKFIGAVNDTDGSVTKWRNNLVLLVKTFAIIIATIISYKSALVLTTLWSTTLTKATNLLNASQKASAITGNLLKGVYLLLSSAYYLLTGQVNKATASMRLFNIAVKINPIGVLLSVITLVTTAVIAFSDRLEETEKNIRNLNGATLANIEAEREFQKSLIATQSKINPLINILKDNNTTLEVRKRAYNDLIKQHPEFIGTVDKEFKATNKLTNAYDSLIEKLKAASRARALENVTQKRDQKLADALDAEFNAEIEFRKEQVLNRKIQKENEKAAKNYTEKLKTTTRESADLSYIPKNLNNNAAKELEKSKILREQAQKESDEWNRFLESEYKKTSKKEGKTTQDNNLSGGLNLGTDSSGSKNKTSIKSSENKEKTNRQKYYEDIIRDYTQNQEELLRLRDRYEDIKLSNIENEFERELAITNAEYLRTRRELEGNKVSDSIFNTLYKARQEAYKKGDMEMVSKLDAVTKTYHQKNQEIDHILLLEANEYAKKSIEIERARELKIVDNLIESGNKKINELKRLQTAELATITDIEMAKDILRRTMSEEEIKQIKSWEDAKKALDKQYQKETLEAQEQFLRDQLSQLQAITEGDTTSGIDFNLLTPEQQTELKEQVEQAKQLINELLIAKNQLLGEESDDKNGNKKKSKGDGNSLNKYSTDILGMSPDDWQLLYDHLKEGKIGFEEIAAVIGVMQNMYSQYAQMVAANENRELQRFEERTNRKKDALSRQLDQGYIDQATYNAEVQKLEDAYNKRKAQIEYNQAKKEKQMALVSSLMGTASAVVGALGKKPWGLDNFILAGLVGAMGAAQTLMIAKQPLPSKGFEDGYIDIQREQDGKMFRAKKGGRAKTGLVSKPTHFLAGEQGQHFPEMIIDGPTWKRMAPDMKQALQSEILRVRGFESGHFNNIASTDNSELIAFLKLNFEVLSKIYDEGLEAKIINDYRNAEQLQRGLDKYNKFKAKTKI
ncbi:phage tail tape measure protein [Faecalibacter sp. LW9]|uniref:phage tail tape measure protein n=1 Tax=Faecalibacter sp. LW9 TaxID=3103144 RepID=UPI002AFEB2F3|nr:phage tail tape measure protein [Faecalibacter sp. LW9]